MSDHPSHRPLRSARRRRRGRCSRRCSPCRTSRPTDGSRGARDRNRLRLGRTRAGPRRRAADLGLSRPGLLHLRPGVRAAVPRRVPLRSRGARAPRRRRAVASSAGAGGSRSTGYGLAAVGLSPRSSCCSEATPRASALDAVFMTLMFPGMLLSVVGSTRARHRAAPRPLRAQAHGVAARTGAPAHATSAAACSGTTASDIVPLFVAWAAAGWRMWRGEPLGAQRVAVSREC